MRGLLKTFGALFAASVLTAPGWAAEIIVDKATGLPADSNYTPETTFSAVSSAIGTSDAHIKLYADGNQSINGAITAASVYIEKPRWQIDYNKTENLQNAGAIYVKGQLFAQTWSNSGTGNIELANDLFIAPNTTANSNYGTIRVGDEGDLTLTGLVTILPNTSTVTIGGEHKGGKRFTLSRLDLSKLASIEERTSAALTIGGNLNCTFSEGSTINLPAGCTGTVKVIAMGTGTLSGFDSSHITVTCGGAALPNGYSAIFKVGGKIEIRSNDTFVDGATFSTTAQDGTSKMSWSTLDDVDSQWEYINTTLAIHFTEDNQIFTFDNTQDVYLTSLAVTAAEGVTGGTIAFPNTEGLVIATTTAINTNVTATGKGTLGAVTIDAGKTLTLNGPVATSFAGQGKLVKAGSDEWTLNAQDWSNVNGLSMEVQGGSVILPNDFNVATPLTIMGGTAEAPISLTQHNKDKSFGSVTVKENSFLELHVEDNTKVNVTGENADTSFVSLIADDDGGWGVTSDTNNTKVSGITLKVTRRTPTADTNIAFWHERSSFLNDASCNLIIDDGINFRLSGASLSVRNLSGVGDITDGADAVKVAPESACQYEGVIRSNAPLTVNGSAPLTLTQAHLSTAQLMVNGQLIFTNSGSWRGAIEVGDRGELTYNRTLTPTNTFTNNGTIAADGAGTEVNLTGATLSGSGTYAVKNGATLILPAGKEGTMEVPERATLALVLSSEQLAFEYVSHTTGTGRIVFKKEVDGSLVDVTAEDGTTTENGTFTPKLNTWEGDSATEAGVYQWSDVNNWSKGRVPAAGDRVVVALGDGIGTPTLTADTPEVELSITGKGSLNLASFTLTAKRIKGESEASTALTLAGTGKVQLNASTTLERKTLEKLSLTVPSGVTLATKLTGSDGNPIFADVAITFANGASWQSYGWLELADTVTVTNAGDLALAMVNGAQPSLWGSGTLKKSGAGTLTVNGMGGTHENPLVIEAGTLNLTSNGTATFTGGISGEGALKIGSGTVVLSTTANTYTGGTEIAKNATLKLTATAAQTLSGNLSGSGALVIGDETAAATVALTGLNEGYSGTITVAERSTLSNGTSTATVPFGTGSIENNGLLKLTATAAQTLSGNLSGSGALEIGDGTAAATVALTGLNEGYSGTITVAERSTLSNGDSTVTLPFGKGRIVNNGTVKLMGTGTSASCGQLPPTSGSGNIDFCAGSTSRIPGEITTTGTVTFEPANGEGAAAAAVTFVSSGDFSEKVASIKGASVVVGEGVTLAKDETSMPLITIAAGRSLSGSGTINVPVAFEDATTATMAPDANLTFTNALTVPQHVTLTGGVTLAAGAVLSGTGNLTGRVVINANAVIDATDSSVEEFLKLSGEQITLGKPLMVKVDGLTKVLNLPTTAGLTLANVQKTDDSKLPTGAKFVLSSSFGADTLMLMVPPALPAAPAESPRDAGVDEAIAAAANALASATLPVVVSEVTKITATGTDGTSSREINAASLFENVLTLNLVDPNTNGTWTATATVAYDFGVADMTIKSLQLEGGAATMYVLLAAKVQNSADSNTASFAEGTKLTVLNGSDEITPTKVSAAVATGVADAAETKGVQWLAVPLATLFSDSAPTGTRSLKVKASKASN